MFLELPSKLLLSNTISKPLFLGLASSLAGGGALSGLIKLESGSDAPISGFLKKVAPSIASIFQSTGEVSESKDWLSPFLQSGKSGGEAISSTSVSAAQAISSAFQSMVKFLENSSESVQTIESVGGRLNQHGTEIKEVLDKAGEKKEKVGEVLIQLFNYRSQIIKVIEEIYKEKDTGSEAARGISEKVGGGQKIAKGALDESHNLISELGTLATKGTEISSQVKTLAQKLISKKSELEGIFNEVDLQQFKGDNQVIQDIRSNWTSYIKKLSKQVSAMESAISTLQSKKEEFKKFMEAVGKDLGKLGTNHSKVSNIFGLDSNQELKLDSVISQFKDIPSEAYKNLSEIYEEIAKSETKAKLVLKSTGKGVSSLVKVIKGGDTKYKTLITTSSTSS